MRVAMYIANIPRKKPPNMKEGLFWGAAVVKITDHENQRPNNQNAGYNAPPKTNLMSREVSHTA